jgi:secreted trypsin-like serine protease
MKIVCAGPTVNNSVTSRVKRYLAIFGGSKVIAREFPHMAALGYVKRGTVLWKCGGTLIHKRFVLTAAHCLEDTSEYPYGKVLYVRLGDIDLNDSADDVDVQMLKVVRRIPYPDYRMSEKYHDIGLLQLDRDVTFNSYVKPACLHSQDTVPEDKLVATGWGRTESGRFSRGKKLLKVELDFHPMQTCNDSMTRQAHPSELREVLRGGLLDDSMLCAGVLAGGKDPCQGDSGGPLQVRAYSPMCDFDVVGITSFGLGCAEPDTPAVYTRVSKYVPWIESVVCSYKDGT